MGENLSERIKNAGFLGARIVEGSEFKEWADRIAALEAEIERLRESSAGVGINAELIAENERLRSLFDTHLSEMGTGWSDSDLHAMECLLDVLRAAALADRIGGE
jgi:hypothetical protein